MSRSSKRLPSDPDYLLNFLDELSSDDSEDDFDGYVTESDDCLESNERRHQLESHTSLDSSVALNTQNKY